MCTLGKTSEFCQGGTRYFIISKEGGDSDAYVYMYTWPNLQPPTELVTSSQSWRWLALKQVHSKNHSCMQIYVYQFCWFHCLWSLGSMEQVLTKWTLFPTRNYPVWNQNRPLLHYCSTTTWVGQFPAILKRASWLWNGVHCNSSLSIYCIHPNLRMLSLVCRYRRETLLSVW